MKLYATTTSERATKGQGGNKQLDIHIKAFDRKNDIAVITVFPWKNTLDDGIPHICLQIREDISYSLETLKGERQKGEKCKICKEKTDINEQGYCPACSYRTQDGQFA